MDQNKETLKVTIKLLKIPERFNGPLFDHSLKNVCPNGIYFSCIFFCFFYFRYTLIF